MKAEKFMNDTVNFWRNICPESHFQSKIILTALRSKDTNKIRGAKTKCQKNLPAS